MAPTEGGSSKIPIYNRNILAIMTPNGHDFSVFDFILGADQGYPGHPTQELWLCSFYYAYG
jgi:hypothetical protein